MMNVKKLDMLPAAYRGQLIGNTGFVHAILVAANLGLADLLRNGPLSIADLAEATGTHAHSLYRMLRTLASRGIFSENADGRFSLIALADPLRSDARHAEVRARDIKTFSCGIVLIKYCKTA